MLVKAGRRVFVARSCAVVSVLAIVLLESAAADRVMVLVARLVSYRAVKAAVNAQP